jgi:molybdopterin synthase sulfur carrier subunit
MGSKVRIPTPLQKLTKDKTEVACNGATVREVIDELERQYPGIKDRICESNGKIRRFVNIYVNDQDIRFLQGENSSVKDGDELSIIPAIAGG